MKTTKALLLTASTALLLAGCGTASNTASCPSDEELIAQGWVKDPENNGYIKKNEDIVSSATEEGKGLTFGYMDQSDAIKQATVLEYLSGLNGNYREMYQIATAINNVPTVSSVEYVLDPTNFNLYGLSEVGTEKTTEFQANPNVSLYWTRQLREQEEEAGMTYFNSYGVQITGQVHIFTEAELDADPSELIHVFETYYPTLPSTAAVWSKLETEDQKIEYIRKAMSAQVVYKIVPSQMVITQPYMLYMGGANASCVVWTSKDNGSYKYPSDFVSASFLDEVIADKQADTAYAESINQLFPETEITDDMSEEEVQKAETNNASREYLLGANTCGIKTQQILTNFTPVK